MATLKQIRDQVARKSQDPSFTARSAEVVDDEINRSIRFYKNFRFWFNTSRQDITLIEGEQRLTGLNADILSELEVGGLILIDDQVKISLQALHPDNFSERDDDQTDRPYFYTYRDRSYDIYPKPNKDYTLEFRYLRDYAPLVNDDDTNDFTENAQDLILLHTLKNIYAEDKQDPAFAQTYQQLENTELRSVKERTDNLIASGTLSSESIIEQGYY